MKKHNSSFSLCALILMKRACLGLLSQDGQCFLSTHVSGRCNGAITIHLVTAEKLYIFWEFVARTTFIQRLEKPHYFCSSDAVQFDWKLCSNFYWKLNQKWVEASDWIRGFVCTNYSNYHPNVKRFREKRSALSFSLFFCMSPGPSGS